MSLAAILQKMPPQQKKAGRLLTGFFAAMLVFTLVSRGVDSFAVATVSTVRPGSGTLTRRLSVSGTVQPLDEVAVAAPEGFLVRRLLVEEGSQVQPGDVLAELDQADIREKLADARRELERAQLDAALAGEGAESPKTDPLEAAELALERAEEDRKTDEVSASQGISRALSDLAQARRELRELRDSDYDDAQLEEARKAITRLERAAEDAYRAAEQGDTAALRAIEDARRAVEGANREKAALDSDRAAKDRTRSLEGRRTALSVEAAQVRVDRLAALLAAEGKILADAGGVITGANLSVGAITTGAGAFLLGEEGGCVFLGKAEEAVGKHLARGDSVEIALPGGSKVRAAIAAIAPPREKGGDYTVRVELTGLQADPSASATLTAEKGSGAKGLLLPLSAVHSAGGSTKSGYVYVLRERNTTMGTQTVVEELAVEILDATDVSAIVTGAFTGEDRVVKASSRPLNRGDRVRLEVDG